MKNIHLVYFSPAFSTRKVIRKIAESFSCEIIEHDITQGIDNDLSFTSTDFVIFGVPVYAGRVPALAVQIIEKIKGDNTPAVATVVYGNRDYDDALLELKEITEKNGFLTIGAGAFVARHSIFPQVAHNRPDEKDDILLLEFGKKCIDKYHQIRSQKHFLIKGNKPYKKASKIPFAPKGNRKCNNCGTCVKMCPTGAIPKEKPKTTDKTLCIACTRCMDVCPQKARRFNGLLFKIVSKKFTSKYNERKEPEEFFDE